MTGSILIFSVHFYLFSLSQAYTVHRLKWFERRQAVYGTAKITRLKLEKFMRSEKVCHRIAKALISSNSDVRTLVIIGSTKTAANSPIKGYIKVPSPQLLRALRVHTDVIEINEFRTTVLCSHCRGNYNSYFTYPTHFSKFYEYMAISHHMFCFFFVSITAFAYPEATPHRFQVCHGCGTVWHRDVNAGNNMFRNAIALLSGLALHPNFSRRVRAPPRPRRRRPAQRQQQ